MIFFIKKIINGINNINNITSCSDFKYLNGNNKYFELIRDIDCTGVTNYEIPQNFGGTLDGKCYTVFGLN